MPGQSRYTAQKLLEWVVGKTAMPSLPSGYLALFTTLPGDDGTGGTECSGGSYARASFAGSAFGSASAADPSVITNSATAISFTAASADWGTVVGFGIYDALSSGNLLWADFLGNHVWRPFTCTLASPGVLTAPGHGFSNGDKAVVTAEFGGALPATGGSWSGLLTVANAATNTFDLGVNTTGVGSGLVRKVTPQVVSSGVQVIFNTSTLTLQAG